MTMVFASGTLELPAEAVFDYAVDYRRMPEWVFGLRTITPIGELSDRVGAEFRGTGKIGPIAMTGTSRITEWDVPAHHRGLGDQQRHSCLGSRCHDADGISSDPR